MPELRQNIATKEWVIISTERAKRPEDFKTTKEKKEIPSWSEKCPFCPGNEKMAPLATFELKDEKGNWKTRCIPNKFPAVSMEGSLERTVDGIIRKMSGVGIHEVIIETPIHNTNLALLSEHEVGGIIYTYRNRYLTASKDERIKIIILFKNHGIAAGTSIEHPHSQLIAVPIVPHNIRFRNEEALRYYDETGECVFCKMLNDELKFKERIVLETGSFVCFVPYAGLSPFHMWIIPRKHNASFGNITDSEISDLAKNLKIILSKMYYGLNNPDYNLVFRSAAVGDENEDYFHWYIAIVPRLIKQAGFELGSGIYVNPTYPEENAKFLREIKIY